MRKTTSLAIITLLATLLSSCIVSKKKYEESEWGRYAAIVSRDSLASLLKLSREQCNQLVADTSELGISLRNFKSMLSSNQNENQKLNEQLALRMSQLEEHAKTIEQLQKIIEEQNEKVSSLLSNVKNALMGFSDEELTVREEGGKVYVAMSDKLLFESASANVNDQGKVALGKLADVLNRQTEIDVYIEGHTDSIPIHNAIFKDNWDLSVIRATSVVRILTESYGVQPLQIQPSGRGEHKPISSNSSAEGRAKNRRTEIIMAPKLDKLFEMLKSN